MARNGAKWLLLLEGRARGRTVKQAAEEAGYSLRQASRIVGTDEFQAELRKLLERQADEDRNAYSEHRRAALGLANLAITKLADVLRSTAPETVVERAARTALVHARELFPSPELLDVEEQLRVLEDAQAQLLGDGGGGRRGLYVVPEAEDWPPAG